MVDDRRGEGMFVAFIVGGLVGATLGLLFSPRSGKENRDFIASKAEELLDEGKEFYDTSVAKVTEESDELRAKIDAARARLQEQVEEATEQAKSKVHEVVPAAKETVEKVGSSFVTGVETAEARAKDVIDRIAEKTTTHAIGEPPAAPGPAEG